MTEELAGTSATFKRKSPRLHLVICNIQKIANVKALLNTAFAFGCVQVLMVRNDHREPSDWIPKQFQRAMEEHQIQLRVFSKWNECVEYLTQNHITLVGVEIDAQSKVLDSCYAPTEEDMAILMGNEGQGIHPKHLQACQGRLIRIPQYGVGTASFNVNVAANIVLYHLHQWKQKQYPQQQS